MSRHTRILLVGGGSGGHVVPLLSVAQAIKQQNENTVVRVWCDRKTFSVTQDLFKSNSDIKVQKILAGKFRRYNHFTWWQNLQPSILFPNIIDIFRIIGAFWQSFWRLIIWRPNVIFCKGGYVGLPVGLVGSMLGIKLVIHDSDTMPGLTNRLLAKFAHKIATGFPIENYPNYQPSKLVYTGIPIKTSFRTISGTEKKQIKSSLKLDDNRPLVLAVGGGLGSVVVNNAVLELAKATPNIQVVLSTGDFDFARVEQKVLSDKIVNIQIKSFFSNIEQYVLASDVVICRAGATTLVELASSRKLAVVIPNHRLTGGHQLKNASMLEQLGAIDVILEPELENDTRILSQKIEDLLKISSVEKEKRLNALATIAKKSASQALARLILELV